MATKSTRRSSAPNDLRGGPENVVNEWELRNKFKKESGVGRYTIYYRDFDALCVADSNTIVLVHGN